MPIGYSIVGGSLNLESLTSAAGLKLPRRVGGNLILSGLPEKKKEKLRQRYPQYANRIY
jgi:hypothetical protein